MAKNKIERIDQEITKVREKIAEYQERLEGAGGTENRGRKSGDRPDGARLAYDPAQLSAMLSRWYSSRQYGGCQQRTGGKQL